jgi:hypothetical protein
MIEQHRVALDRYDVTLGKIPNFQSLGLSTIHFSFPIFFQQMITNSNLCRVCGS